MRISLIVAVARNGVIGRDGALAWRISDDLKRFKRLTSGHPIIMGRKTFDSIGKALPGRTNIVISRSMPPRQDVLIADSLETAFRLASAHARSQGVNEVFVIGGAEIYRLSLPFADRIHLTEVDAEIEGDVRFPDFDVDEWVRSSDGRSERSERNEFACEYFILERKQSIELTE